MMLFQQGFIYGLVYGDSCIFPHDSSYSVTVGEAFVTDTSKRSDYMNIVELETELTRLEVVRAQTEKNTALRFPVLLADDCEEDRILFRLAVNKSLCLKPVAEVRDGVEAVEYLSGQGQYGNREKFPFPELLLLDIQMPRLDGLGVLGWLQNQDFPNLRVVMLSASLDPANIQKVLALGADYYQAKDIGETMEALIRRLELLMVLMHHREPKRFMKNLPPPSHNEDMQSYTTLKLVDGRADNWEEAIRAAADSKRNFIFIVKTEQELEKLWSALGTTSIVPERIHRWGILAMAEALQTDDYAFLLESHEDNAVYLIGQLTLERNAPPLMRRYMLYCELRGIISDHNTLEEAGTSLLSYLNFFKRAPLLPLAGIYEYLNGKWVRVKKLTSEPMPTD